MRSTLKLLGVLLTLALGATTGASAQTLVAGTWTGKAVDPGGEEIALTFVVETGEKLKLSIVAPDGEQFAVDDVRFENGKLLFRWEAGVTINCTLAPSEGGGFSGPCVDDTGAAGTITMVPPRAQG